jgi:hypothetical protein
MHTRGFVPNCQREQKSHADKKSRPAQKAKRDLIFQ